MILDFCGVKLRKIDEEDLEMLRQWRNDSKIAQFMFFQDQITREAQIKWFRSLKETDFYFIIEYKKTALGLINLSNIDRANKEAHAGLFIYDEKYWGGPLPIIASVCLLQFAFENQNITQVFAKVQINNKAAISYNKSLGFIKYSEEWQVLNQANYERVVLKLKKAVLKIYK